MTTSTTSLTDFLLARIAEDEWRAQEATPGRWYADEDYSTVTAEPFKSARQEYGRDFSTDVDCWVIPESMDSGVGGHNLAHIARHDPARVLAECEAKRPLLAQWRDATPDGDDWAQVAWDTMLAWAVAYADHPDYDESWRP